MQQNGERSTDLDERVMQALERAPVVRVPDSFASRVAAAAVSQPVAKVRVRRRMSLGRMMSLAAMVVMAAALFIVAPMAGTRVQSWPFALEMVLLAQLAAVAFGWMRTGIRD